MSARSAASGYAVVSKVSDRDGALVQAIAADGQLTMITDEVAPEPYSFAVRAAGIGTMPSFILADYSTSFE